ncbi:Glutathione-dependent formaldehyde-activating family GFA [Macrophomina phaseolina MS6]|uniref:Glutathione-dependent formaldehyde-activating family GFA n=1 Tax=Macrophomina phaseolina (strain MS6) TaxID=1126212 RepID=K2RI60_MACPH|nr:Glutathione-dependent formaldehyde-activating family GFA [Macrophomina phaseolina MS6]
MCPTKTSPFTSPLSHPQPHTPTHLTHPIPVQALCHCISCRRSSNSTHSTNLLVPTPSFHPTSGTAKQWTRTGDSGKTVTNNFCGECGTLLWVTGEAMTGVTIVKAGTLDDLSLNDTKYKPKVEIFTRNKYSWLADVEGAAKFEGSMSA